MENVLTNDIKPEYAVYIDESGDLGIGKGTRWFVISAIVVQKDEEPLLRSAVSNIKNKLNLNCVHFRNIREFQKRLYIVKQIYNLPFTTINVIVDTSKWDLRDSEQAYNYLSRILLERVSWFLRDNCAKADVVFSSRNTRRDKELIEYLNNKVLNYEWNKIAPNTIASISSEKMEKYDMLQLADVCAAAMFKSHEPDTLGFIYPCYMNNLRDHLYTHNSKVFSYGMKYYSNNMQLDKSYIEEHSPCRYCTKNEKTPRAN